MQKESKTENPAKFKKMNDSKTCSIMKNTKQFRRPVTENYIIINH